MASSTASRPRPSPNRPRCSPRGAKAGLPLGNHGWSHADLAKLTDDQFADELAKNEPLLASLMGDADWHWFRYPFLSEAASDPERPRGASAGLLASRGYKVAPVTMSFADYAYNDPYARCVAKGDQAAIAQLEAAYLAGAEAEAANARAMAKTLTGRDVPYVLLMHLGAFDARMMPRLLALYQRLGLPLRHPARRAEGPILSRRGRSGAARPISRGCPRGSPPSTCRSRRRRRRDWRSIRFAASARIVRKGGFDARDLRLPGAGVARDRRSGPRRAAGSARHRHPRAGGDWIVDYALPPARVGVGL
ncbi:MAG: polysaccharide deacetylase family protein [Sphingomonas sp.]